MSNLTQAQAERAYRKIVQRYNEQPHNEIVEQGGARWPDGRPVLCRNFEGWTSTTRWAVVWEEGPFEWAIGAAAKTDDLPKSVFIEPINGFALGLHPS